MTSLVQQLKR